MSVTTNFGTWCNATQSELTVESDVANYVSGGPSEWLDRVNEFIGPHYPEDREFNGYSEDEYGGLGLGAIISSIDLAAVVERHEPDLINQDATLSVGRLWHALTIGGTTVELPVRANEVVPTALLMEIADQALTEAGWEHTATWTTVDGAPTAPVTLA
jgi:hypothetical protein